MKTRRRLLLAAQVVDSDRVSAVPGALLLEDSTVIAAGTPQSVGIPTDVEVVDCCESILIPALVNAHSHLDLTHVGPVNWCGDFVNWIAMVRRIRARNDAEIESSVAQGVKLARRGGTGFVGDIAGDWSLAPCRSLRRMKMKGVSFVEVFGLEDRQSTSIARIEALRNEIRESHCGVRIGLQPHAPYSCGPEIYRHAAGTGFPLSTHLAESRAEVEFTTSGTGPLADLLRGLGVWSGSTGGAGSHPVDLLESILRKSPWLLAHLNYVEDRHLGLLAESRATVVYCPRASAYFGHAGHRYRDMIDAGVNVALGTDSIICLDTPDRISVLDEIRFLLERDETPARSLLRMATVAGARGLGLEESLTTFAPGPIGGVLSLELPPRPSGDLLRAALRHAAAPRFIAGLPDSASGP